MTCFVRARAKDLGSARLRYGEATDPDSLRDKGFCGDRFDVLVSCLASRNGAPNDAWAVDCQANLNAFAAAKASGVGHVVLLSAICVQKPRLAFQRAKLEAERALVASGMRYSIVRPTAFFKSLSGQIGRVQEGKAYLLFGDGCLTACKPISDLDLGNFLVECVENEDRHDRVLPIGGPGPALTPRQMGAHLFELSGRAPKFRAVPVGVLRAVIWGMSALGRIFPGLADKAELARIAHYYATESMLVWDDARQVYDADETPETGRDRISEHYAEVLRGKAAVDLGAHKVF